MEVQFRYQPTDTLIKCEVDTSLTVGIVIKEMIQPAIYSNKSLFSFFPLQLSYNGEKMDINNTFGSYNYIPETEILVSIVDSYPNTEDDYNIGIYALFSRALLKQDIEEVCNILGSKEQIPDIFCTLLKIFTASISEEFFFSEQLVPTEENNNFSLISVICDWLRMYGGERIIEYNSVVTNILLLLGSIFKEIPITSFSEQEILDVWHGVFYILDSALFTYSINDGNENGDYPTYSTYTDELLRMKPQLDAVSESYLRNTVEMVVFLFSHFFQCPSVLKEFQTPFFYKTVSRLLELYCDSQFIMGMFFYQFGCAINATHDLGLPSLWNSPLSLRVAEVIMQEIPDYVDYSLTNRDSVDIIDITGRQIPFTTCYTYCLGVICSFMSDDLEKVMIDTKFIYNLKKSVNAFYLWFSSQEDSKGEDALEFKSAFICYLRLICILTYDFKACMLLMSEDLEKEKETEEDDGNKLFLTVLCTFMKKMWNDPIAILLFSHILRNLSSYQRLGKFMSLHNSWYSYLYVLFAYEKTLAEESESQFVPDCVPFIRRETELERGSYTLSMSLLNNLLRCVINLSVSYPSFVKVVVESEGWTSCELLSFLIDVPSNTSLAITTMLFIQTIVTHHTAYDRTLVQSVLSHAFESIENEHNEIVGQRGQMSEQRYNAYSILYNQAIEIAAKLDPFIAKNEGQEWDVIQRTPISDNEIAVLFYSIPLDLYSLRIHFDDMKQSLLCSHIYYASEGSSPNMEEDIPYNVFLPVNLPAIIFDAIFYDSSILHIEYEGEVISEDSPVNCDEEREVTIVLISPSFNSSTLPSSISSIRHSMAYPPTVTSTLHNPLNEINPDVYLHNTGTSKSLEMNAIGEEDEYVTVNAERIASRERRKQHDEDHIEEQADNLDSIDISLEQIPDIYPGLSVTEKPSSPPVDIDVEETDEVDDVLKPLGLEIGKPHGTMKGTIRNTLRSYATMYSTMKGETMSVEMFKISMRNIDQDQIFKPSITVSHVFDDEKSSKLKIKRMMKNLKIDGDNDTHSMIILDFVREGGLSRYWYVLQNVAQDLSNYSVEDYIMVVEGCVESLPAALKSSSFESVKNDLFLVYHYLNECCGYEAVMYDLITYQSYALIEGLIEFHHLCYGCNESDYLTDCMDCILSVFQNIVINQGLIKKCLESPVMELFADILHRQMITSPAASQQLLSLISIMGKFFRVCDAEHREIVQKEIKVIIDFVHDPTCLRRLNRLLN